MDLIVTHRNADFDALSSLVAAGKLYPGARLLLPGSQEKSVRNFLSLIKDKVRIEDEKTCRMDDVDRLVIVDNRHRSRIGTAADLLGKKGLKVHIYDHHPRTRSDIKGDKDVFKEVGATVSILLEILDKKGRLNLTPLEATLMLLGIYEETGSLSYTTTTKLEVDMVSRLLEQGANLNAVSSYLNRELSSAELSTLIHLLQSMRVEDVNGVEVAFAHVDSGHLDGEMGTVVHKLQDVENFPVLFAMFESKGRIKVLARSRVEPIDVNKLLGHFNGAGHSSAASARVEDRSYERLVADILGYLRTMTRPETYAADIMNYPVKTVSQEEKVSEVKKKLERFGPKGAPVLNEEGEPAGMITLGDIKKALKHGMGHSRVKGYMATPLVTAAPETPLFEIKKIMVDRDKGRVPVIKGDKLVGIITRNDVLKTVYKGFFPGTIGEKARTSDISARMRKILPRKLMEEIRLIGAQADELGVKAFLIGGFVRDIILGKENYDLDIVVEGNAIKFGRILGEKLGGSLVVHKKFGTCTLVRAWPGWLGKPLNPDNKFKIDIATARKEVYERPAALPTVEFSSLREDLYRRDFTINAMAVNVNRENFGLFVDFFGGMKDLRKGVIRILHDRSFIDDPTRIFRAVRFEQRFGFKIEKHTEYLITHAVKREMFRRTENQRIRDELILILKERNPEKAVFRMRQLHELRFIHPELVLKTNIGGTFREIRKCVRWYMAHAAGKRQLDVWLMNLMVLLDKLTADQVEEVLGKFVFTRSESLRLRSYKRKAGRAIRNLSSRKRIPPSRVYSILEPLSHEVTLCAMARTRSSSARRRIKRFFSEYNGTKLKIKGDDIRKEGIRPGPRYKKILRSILYRKLDGKLPAKKDELRYMRELISGKR